MRFIGIDIGKNTIHVCVADNNERNPRHWPVYAIDLKSDTWYKDLTELIQPGETIAALEPTGWYYSRPIIAVLEANHTTILQVGHQTSKATRAAHISSQKTDANDARALAFKAANNTNGVREIKPELSKLAIEMRLAIGAFLRAKQLRSKYNNRLDAYARGIWPSLVNNKNTWLTAVSVNAVTPDEIIALAERIHHWPLVASHQERTTYAHHQTRNALYKLADQLPTGIEIPQALTEAVIENYQHFLNALEEVKIAEQKLETLIQHPLLADVTAAWKAVPAWSATELAAIHAACNCDARNFTTDQFRAAVGCHPSRQESGQITEAKATKRGYRPAKAALHLWTIRLLSEDASPQPNPVSTYFKKLKASNNPHAIHAARGKLARILSGIARNEGTPRFG